MNDELKELQHRLLEMLISFKEFTDENDIKFFLAGGSALGAVRHQGFIPWDDDIDIAMMREDFEKLEQLMAKRGNQLGEFAYSPVEHHICPEAPISYLYDLISNQNNNVVNAKIDIHPIDGVPKSGLLRKIQKIVSLIYYLSVYRLPVKNKGKGINMISKIIIKLTPGFLFKAYMRICKKIITAWKVENSENICSLFGIAGYDKEVMPKNYLEPFDNAKFETSYFLLPGNPHKYLEHLYGDYMKLPPEEDRQPKIHYNNYRAMQ